MMKPIFTFTKKKVETLLMCLLLITCSGLCYGQNVQNVTATFDNLNGAVNVNYDLLGNGKKRYKVDLFCSVDGGQTFSDALIGVSRDVGYNVKQGMRNQINWAYFVDMPDFTGKNVVMKVVAKEDVEYRENIILSLGGPEKFYQSILIPGYGNYHVRNGKRYFAISGIVYGLLGAGVYCHLQAKNNYSDYKKATSGDMADQKFNNTQKLSNLSNGLLIGGAAIWTIDVGQVIIKGIRNRKMQRDILKRRQK
jgi:hypothetical protein